MNGVLTLVLTDQKTWAAELQKDVKIDLGAYSDMDIIVPAAWFKDVDKTITIITAKGQVEIKTKTLWNNSGKNRQIMIRNGKVTSLGNS